MFILPLSVALAMDALAVSIGIGVACPRISTRKALTPPLLFGAFQALMPLIGYFLSTYARGKFGFEAYDHWIAFAMLLGIGGKMILDTWKELKEGASNSDAKNTSSDKAHEVLCDKFPSVKTLIVLAIATSIDALAAGITIACLGRNIFFDITIIGIGTFLFSLLGLKFGAKIGEKAGAKFGYVGGAILILIGVKILIQA